jgi:hypothetical protein
MILSRTTLAPMEAAAMDKEQSVAATISLAR